MYRHFPHFMALTHVSSSVLRLHGREFCFVERNLEGVVSDKNIVLFFGSPKTEGQNKVVKATKNKEMN